MGFYQRFRQVLLGRKGLLGAISAHIGGDGEEGDSQQDNQAGSLQIITVRDEGNQEQTAANDRTDHRKVIQ
jgi:hypothetical protein